MADTGDAGSLGRIRVLIVDDQRFIRELVQLHLETDSGIEVVATAGDGLTALHLAAVHQPDVVLLDIAMPGMGGVEVAQRLRAEYPSMAVVVLTALEDPAAERAMHEAEVAGYLFKTQPAMELLGQIRSAAGNRRRRQSAP
jgi:DNA-binding NarL/FixJ family response regulator